jgi:WD repeat and SOF domain-containing protein 1
MFAKPFLGQLGSGHVQGVYSMCKVCSRKLPKVYNWCEADNSQDKNSLNSVASGSGDGVIKVWDLTTRDDETWRTAAQ